MEYDLSHLIESLRQQKSLTVNELCEGIISKSAYSRFVNGHTMIKADILLQLASRLNLTFVMFGQDFLDFFKLKHDYTALLHGKSYKEYERIADLVSDYENRELTRKYDQIFLKTAKLLLDEAEGREANINVLEESQRYFAALEQWTDYDCKAFKNIMHLYTLEFNLEILKQLLESFEDLTDPYLPEEIYYIIAPNVHRLLLAGRHDLAKRLFEVQETLFIGALDPARTIYNKLSNALLEMVIHENIAYLSDYEAMIELYFYLGAHNSVQEFTDLYQQFQAKHKLPGLSVVLGGVRVESS